MLSRSIIPRPGRLLVALRSSCALLPLGVAAAAPAGAQLSSRVVVGGGVATDALGVRSSAVTAAPSVAVASPRASLSLSGSATRFDAGGWFAEAAASSGTRLPLGGPLAITLDGSASAALTSFDARLSTLEAIPAIELRAGPATLFAGGRLAHGASSIPAPGSPLDPFARGASSSERTARSARGALAGIALAHGEPATGAVAFRAAGERSTIAGEAIADATASLTYGVGRVRLGASAGARSAPDERIGYGAGSLGIDVARGVALELAAGSYPSNRLTGTAAGRFLSAAVSLRSGGSRVSRAAPARPDAAPRLPRGHTRLALRAPSARRVEIAGDWNDWRPVLAHRAPNGVWYADLAIPPGRYRYAFRLDGAEWRVPPDAPATRDEFGATSAWLLVPGTR